ncbi:MAG: flagellar basal body L-ring protein FlgH [Alphaproteobacteria bacterium]
MMKDKAMQMNKSPYGTSLRACAMVALGCALTGCNALDRISEIGRPPQMAPVEDPTRRPGYTPVRMPMPITQAGEKQANSLWQTGSRAFFRDQRATRVGDIMTVVIAINDKAQMQNETKRSRTNGENSTLDGFLGYEQQLKKWLPDAVGTNDLVKLNSTGSSEGKGSVGRQEQINLRVAATITQVLPNGNLVISGKQQMVVNFDMRELQINGVVRPEDISSENTVNYDQIAEARITYGGRGQVMDVQQPRYGQQLYDVVFPF